MASGSGAEKRRDSPDLLSRENLYALALCLIVILLIVVTSDSAPQWIYQGF